MQKLGGEVVPDKGQLDLGHLTPFALCLARRLSVAH